MHSNVCKECGKIFETSSSRKKYCDNQHYRKCKVCGKVFPVSVSEIYSDKQTCSDRCRSKLIKVYQKSKHSNIEKICRICGKHYVSLGPDSGICDGPHYKVCEVCGKSFLASRQQLLSKTRTCSKACRYVLARKVTLDRFGNDAGNWSSELIDRQKATLKSRYGVDNAMKLQESKDKARQTCLDRYGTTSFTKTVEFYEKCIETNRKRYGVDWEAQTDNHKNAVIRTSTDRYGVSNPGKYFANIVDRMSDPTKYMFLMSFRDDPRKFINEHFSEPPTLSQLSSLCGIRASSVGEILDKAGARDAVKFSYSNMEDEVIGFLKTILPSDEEIICRTRRVITPKELDIYLPARNFAIECNPTCTHNSTNCVYPSLDEPKPIRYHYAKTDKCLEQGIFLFHIFGYDWSCKQDIIKSMIANDLGCTANRIYARNTQVKLVNNSDATQFLNDNHRQGSVNCRIRLGLYFNNQLVSLMTFSKMRNTVGTGNEDLSDCWELVRFCNILNTSVVGGASKLFSYFVHNYYPQRIRSFSDRAHTRGGLYQKLGFSNIRTSEPGYVWVDEKTDIAYSRLNAQKRNISKFLKDPNIDLSKTEKEIMIAHEFVQVFDSGTILWEWRKGDDERD